MAVAMRWFLPERLAKTISTAVSAKPMASVMKCAGEKGWKGFVGMFLEKAGLRGTRVKIRQQGRTQLSARGTMR